jgi:cytochrome c biogenesis protein CcmG, thiol:disulfide interchange protein DsbE
MSRRLILWAPLAVFAVFLAVFAVSLYSPSQRTVPSRLIGQPVPEFRLDPALGVPPGLSSETLRRGQPRLVNIFASWCIPCRAEAAQLDALARRGIPIDGIAVRDRPEDLAAFLRAYGDPFATIGADNDRQVQLALGSAGVPETFIVDGNGIIRHQHIGAINPQDVPALVAAWEAAR